MEKRKCTHKKLVLAAASGIEFQVDQEPYESGKIESCGFEVVQADLFMHYCPICNTATVETTEIIGTY